jgi:hypothetical protein
VEPAPIRVNCAALPGACCRWCCSGDCKGRAGAIQPIAITIIGDIYRLNVRYLA